MVINFKDGNGEPLVVSNFKSIPANGSVLSRNDEVIQIEYQKDETTYLLAIPIKVKYPVDIEVLNFKNRPKKSTDQINIDGLSLKIVYNDGSFYIKNDGSGITTEPETGTVLGDARSLKINYESISIIYDIINSSNNIVENTSKIVTFRNGTWSEIKEFISAVENGEYNIKDYWKVGDCRYEKFNSINLGNTDTYNYLPIEYSVKFIILDLDNHTDAMSKYNAMISNISTIEKEVVLGSIGRIHSYYSSLKDLINKMFVLNSVTGYGINDEYDNSGSILAYNPTDHRGYIQRLFKDQTVNSLMKEVLFFSLHYINDNLGSRAQQIILRDKFITQFSLYELFGESMYDDNKFKNTGYENSFKFDKNGILNGISSKKRYNPVHLEYFKTASNVRTHNKFIYNDMTKLISALDPSKENGGHYIHLRDLIPVRSGDSNRNDDMPRYSYYNPITKYLYRDNRQNLDTNEGYITFCI